MKKILFVCTANICRSPMAAALFNAFAPDLGVEARAESAGVAALRGEPMAPNSAAVLREIGVEPDEGHRGRQASREVLETADLVLTMSPQHAAALRRQFGSSAGKVYTLPEYAAGRDTQDSISDPYGHSISSYRASLRQISEYVEQALRRLEREGLEGEAIVEVEE
jgi:protein-tyrosine-phosphatase